jgi:hypothetical protein
MARNLTSQCPSGASRPTALSRNRVCLLCVGTCLPGTSLCFLRNCVTAARWHLKRTKYVVKKRILLLAEVKVQFPWETSTCRRSPHTQTKFGAAIKRGGRDFAIATRPALTARHRHPDPRINSSPQILRCNPMLTLTRCPSRSLDARPPLRVFSIMAHDRSEICRTPRLLFHIRPLRALAMAVRPSFGQGGLRC